jgi:hypothetical protein
MTGRRILSAGVAVLLTEYADIPTEVFQQIVDYLANDYSTLRTLSLTSRLCRATAIRHLFSVLSINDPNSLTSWKQRCLASVDGLLPSCIRQVRVRAGNAIVRGHGKWIGAFSPTAFENLPVLPRAEKLTWENKTPNTVIDSISPALLALLSTMPNLRSMSLSGFFLDHNALLEFFSFYRRLECINLAKVSFRGPNDPGLKYDYALQRTKTIAFTTDPADLQNLREIELPVEENAAATIMDSVLNKARSRSIRAISVHRSLEDVTSLQNLVRYLGMYAGSLAEFTLRPTRDSTSFDLGPLSSALSPSFIFFEFLLITV